MIDKTGDDRKAPAVSAKRSNPKERPRRRTPKRLNADRSTSSVHEDRYLSRSICRALDVLDSFSAVHPEFTLKELSKRVSIPESSLFRVLLTLEKRNYLVQNSDGSYQLSPRLLHGRSLDDAKTTLAVAQPEMQALASRFNETVSLAHLFEDRIQVLEVIESFHDIRIGNRRGRVLPPHCSAMGKIITAMQPPEQIHKLLEVYGLNARTVHTVTDRNALLNEFKIARKQGYAFDREESTLGGICVAAAIQSRNHTVAAISISTPMARMTAERERQICKAVLESAQKISQVYSAAMEGPSQAR
jgi:DNA-binding IclR family transcriptional regulator